MEKVSNQERRSDLRSRVIGKYFVKMQEPPSYTLRALSVGTDRTAIQSLMNAVYVKVELP